MARFPDGNYGTYRIITSTKGSLAIEISLSKETEVKTQKIHFVSKGE